MVFDPPDGILAVAAATVFSGLAWVPELLLLPRAPSTKSAPAGIGYRADPMAAAPRPLADGVVGAVVGVTVALWLWVGDAVVGTTVGVGVTVDVVGDGAG